MRPAELAASFGLNGIKMREGDGAAITSEEILAIEADTEAEILLIDLP